MARGPLPSERLPVRINPFRLAAALLAAFVIPSLVWADDTPKKPLATVLQPYVDRRELAGAVVLVADREKVLDVEAVGFMDVAAKKPMTTDALFWIASQSKPITATALMMLVDEGKVKLDDPVEKYIPEFKEVRLALPKEGSGEEPTPKKPAHPITVREILGHTSGLPFASAQEKPTLDALTLKDAVKSYAKTPLLFEPGTKYQYSNAGINTAGRIIEVVSGMPYEDFLQKRLFDPLAMKDTTFWPDEQQLKRLAKAYKPVKEGNPLAETTIGQLKYPLSDRKRQPMPAGGLFSTAADVSRFCRMVLNGGTLDGKKYLSEDAVRQMTAKQTGDRVKDNYGLGWSTGGTFGHGGAFATNMTIDPKRGLVYVYMVQHAGFPGEGGKAQGTFRKAAEESFGGKK
jgi:CubicO group peptidase (beta-lactamase class C family)